MMASPRRKLWVSTVLLLLLQITPVSKSAATKTCSDYQESALPTLCLRLQDHTDKTEEYSILNAIGALKLKDAIFPLCKDFWTVLIAFDEPLHPIPLGPSIYFCLCIALLVCYFMTKLVRTCFESTKKKMLLHPQTAKLPNLPLYWLQQSKREQSLKREVRNTWAWLAKKFMLSPADPLLEGIDETLSNTTWEDFQTPRDTWSLINAVLQMNELYIGVHHSHDDDGKESSTFHIKKGRRDPTGTVQAPFSRLPREMFPEDLHEGGGDDYDDEEEEVQGPNGVWKLKKTKPPDLGKVAEGDTATPAPTPTTIIVDGQAATGVTFDPVDTSSISAMQESNKIGHLVPDPNQQGGGSGSSTGGEAPAMTKQDWKEHIKKKKQSRVSLFPPPLPTAAVRHLHKTKHIRHHRRLRGVHGSKIKHKRDSHLHSLDPVQALDVDHKAYAASHAKKSHPAEGGPRRSSKLPSLPTHPHRPPKKKPVKKLKKKSKEDEVEVEHLPPRKTPPQKKPVRKKKKAGKPKVDKLPSLISEPETDTEEPSPKPESTTNIPKKKIMKKKKKEPTTVVTDYIVPKTPPPTGGKTPPTEKKTPPGKRKKTPKKDKPTTEDNHIVPKTPPPTVPKTPPEKKKKSPKDKPTTEDKPDEGMAELEKMPPWDELVSDKKHAHHRRRSSDGIPENEEKSPHHHHHVHGAPHTHGTLHHRRRRASDGELVRLPTLTPSKFQIVENVRRQKAKENMEDEEEEHHHKKKKRDEKD